MFRSGTRASRNREWAENLTIGTSCLKRIAIGGRRKEGTDMLKFGNSDFWTLDTPLKPDTRALPSLEYSVQVSPFPPRSH